MANLVSEKLTTQEFMMLEEMLGNGALMMALRKIFGTEEHARMENLRSEALGQSRPGEMVRSAAESRVFSEWEAILKRGMARLAPQQR